ncbi:hypothetical protein PMIN07_001808 [Paraphaeosphaeria minitans]|uniref:DUF7892 domain-containing protein n=1 Tax=Paraphaeosphaeria minitans TaxID=565426 RepID=A0A9P6GHX2_9PLEO|nr:hypothetical protein PMIN01_05842 [Paraphaeosphaeria minitans]
MHDRESSTASSVDFYGSETKPNTPPAQHRDDVVITKRKPEESALPPQKKKRRLESTSVLVPALKPCAGLSPATWQHVFLRCSLFDLGRLLQVNRSFHSYLTAVQDVSVSDPGPGSLRLIKSDSIWAAARNALPVKSPKPLPGFSELHMWQLVWSRRCQFCQKLDLGTAGDKFWQRGPGNDGVRTIWPFGIRACGECLVQRCQTDASLLFSSVSALRAALPYAVITNDRNYVPAHMLQAASVPAAVEVAKYYYKPQVEEISSELNEALALGPAAAEEWSRGLDARGYERMRLAENWSRWEDKYQSWLAHNDTKSVASSTPAPPQTFLNELGRSPTQHTPSLVIHVPLPASKYLSTFHPVQEGRAPLQSSHILGSSLTEPAPIYPHMHSRPPTVPQQYTPQAGNPRGLHDANEAKANRRADIERRCQQMRPSIPPNVLRHMDSFRAAIQISQPMTEDAWSVLEPRLVAQLPAAQQAEADHVSRLTTLPKTLDRRPSEVNPKESKEIMDREWDEAQRPIRDKLSAIADDFINRDWDGGRAVTYESSPKFAVDVLVHVRRTFKADTANESATSVRGHSQNTSHDGSDPNRPKLVLDSMKWVYDNKIKNLTEQFRKELFLCYGSGCEGNTKFYGFEGVVQHFGAKHTNAFSVGNVVVAWREAEWPEDTPFHPDPTSVKPAFHSASGSTAHSGYGAYYGGYSRAGTSTPHMQAHLPQASPGPYQYNGHYAGPFAPPQMGSTGMPGYEYNQSYGSSMDAYHYQSIAPSGFGAHPGNGYMTSPAITNTAIAPPPSRPLQAAGMRDMSHRSDDASHRTSLFDKQVSTVIDMALDIWKQTSGVKDLPNSLRIYVLMQRVISKFHVDFNHEPNLDHFIDAFSSRQVPRALKNAPGLSCKACQDEVSHYLRQEERKTYTVSSLFLHFKSQHLGSQAQVFGNGHLPKPLDWKEDMIELPSDRLISGLIHAPGMDDDKLHTVATVFPKLFPTPLPSIGKVDNGEFVPKDPKDAANGSGTPGRSIGGSVPSSLASPYTGSPKLFKPTEDEYDPLRPALSTRISSRTNGRTSYRGSPADHRQRYYVEPRYQPLDPSREKFDRPHEYIEYAPGPRHHRDSEPVYEEYQGMRPLYRDEEAYYRRDEIVFAHPRAGRYEEDYRPVSRHVRYVEDDTRQPGHQLRDEPVSIGPSPADGKSAADRFLEGFVPNQTVASADQGASRLEVHQPVSAGPEPGDGSRYTPPPPSFVVPEVIPEQRRAYPPPHRTASTVSNGSRNDDHHSSGRQVPTPDNTRGLRRPGPQRRRERYHDHVPSRYYRYLGAAREEPYPRGSSMSRAQSKRYEEQRRRIDQQETPQPGAEQDSTYSRDQSVERGAAEEAPIQPRRPPQDYVSVQDRLHPYSPPRLRYADSRYTEDPRGGRPPMYVDEYGRPLEDYEVIQVPRDPRPPRHSYGRYVEYEPEHVQYVPVAYERPHARHYQGTSEYVYHEGREGPLPPRRPVYEPEEPPPPAIKVENAAPGPDT